MKEIYIPTKTTRHAYILVLSLLLVLLAKTIGTVISTKRLIR